MIRITCHGLSTRMQHEGNCPGGQHCLILPDCGHSYWIPVDHLLTREERAFEKALPCPDCPQPQVVVESTIDFECPDCRGNGDRMVWDAIVGLTPYGPRSCLRCQGTGRVEFLDPVDPV